MAKKVKRSEDGKKKVVVEGRDQKRLADLEAQTVQLQRAFEANRYAQNVIFRSYVKENETMTGYDAKTGTITILKQKPPKKEEETNAEGQ